MKQVLLPVLLFFLYAPLQGQSMTPELISAAGNQSSNTDYIMEWSIGETVTGTLTGDYIVFQGFQQGLYLVEGIAKPASAGIKIRLYPNPVNNILHIDMTGLEPAPLSWDLRITGMNGWVKQVKTIRNLRYDIDLSSYPVGTYVFQLLFPHEAPQTFKIIKK